MSNYLRYYDHQIGGGGGLRVKNVFSGSTYQRGHGVGAWLGGLARLVIPCITSGAKVVGKEAIRTGLNVLDDVTNNHVDLKQSLKTRARESGNRLKRKASVKIIDLMRGDGYKTAAPKRKRQSKKKHSRVRNSGSVRKKKTSKVKRKKKNSQTKKKKTAQKKKRDISDIFGPR